MITFASPKPTEIDIFAPENIDIITRLTNLMFAVVDEPAITEFEEVASHYQIILSNRGPLDHVTLKVETVPSFDFDEIRRIEDLQKRIMNELKSNLQVSVEVKVVEPKSIERSEGKAKRVLDLRKAGA